MVYGYVRVSTEKQTVEGQINAILREAQAKQIVVHKWLEVEMSSKKGLEARRIAELLGMLQEGDTIIVTEISRLGRSIKEVLGIIEEMLVTKGCRLIIIKQNLDLTRENKDDVTNKVLITLLTMLAELERDFISMRTKEGLRAVKASGVKLGKPLGKIQSSVYDKDKERIKHLYSLGVPIKNIIDVHLGYGKYLSLRNFIIKHKLKKGVS